MDDDEDEDDASQPGHRHYPLWLKMELEKASGTAEWHAALASLIRNSLTFTDYELAEFADLVSAPRKRKRGRQTEIERNNRIFLDYIFRARKRGESESTTWFGGTRAEAIRHIQNRKEFPTLCEESAATKAYDNAKKYGLLDRNAVYQRKGNK
jgi:hypothetical protein